MYLKVIAADELLSIKPKFTDIAKATLASGAFLYSAAILSLSLIPHFGTGALGGETIPISEAVSAFDDPGLAKVANDISLFRLHSSGTLGLTHTVGLSGFAIYYGFDLVKDTVQKLRRGIISIENQIALSVVMPFSISIFNLLSGHYIPCCPTHFRDFKDIVGRPLQNFVGAIPGLSEAVFLAVTAGYFGNVLEKYAEDKARKNLARELNKSSLGAYLVRQGNILLSLPVADIKPGMTLILKEGEQLPVDAEALEPISMSKAHITGESRPVDILPGQTIYAGASSLQDSAKVRVLRAYEDSALAQQEKQINLILNNKTTVESKIEKFCGKWSLGASIFSILYFIYGVLNNHMIIIKNAITLLVVTTPCALRLALSIIKLAVITKKDIILKPKSLAAANKVNIVVLDKTNTLTDNSHLSINALSYGKDIDEKNALSVLYSIELLAMHPIAENIRKYIGPQEQTVEIQDFQDLGKAVQGVYLKNGQKHTVRVGSMKYFRSQKQLSADFANISDEAVVMSIDGQLQLSFEYSESLREDAVDTLIALQKMGKEIVIASGDTRERVNAMAELINTQLTQRGAKPLEQVYAEWSPEQKMELVIALQKDQQGQKQYVAMVGDGNNDSLAMAAADFSISWNAAGTARNAADALVTDAQHLAKITDIFNAAKRYFRKILLSILLPLIGNILIIAGIHFDTIGYALNYLGCLYSDSLGGMLRPLDMLAAMILHEGLTFFTAWRAGRGLWENKSPRLRRQHQPD